MAHSLLGVDMYWERLQRQLGIIGKIPQAIIALTSLCVVGVGGNGGVAALLAVLSGFRRIILIDPDVLELSNLNRFVLGGWRDVGKPKVVVAKRRLRSIDPGVRCEAIPEPVESEAGLKALQQADAIVSCVDSLAPRIFLNGWCTNLGRPLLDIGSGGAVGPDGIRFLGSRASLYVPGRACQRCIWMDDEPMHQSQVSLATINTIATAAGFELLLGHFASYGERVNMIVWDSINREIHSLYVERKAECSFCAEKKD